MFILKVREIATLVELSEREFEMIKLITSFFMLIAKEIM